ncbi:MAG TPA: 16S rRNA (adenine(1518)-N(6)/adenine(1519)-N(6))-dimethyltransferase RsmA [Gemmatimonadaceae bacterium]
MSERRQNPPVLKRYGQHFLKDRAVLADIASAVDSGRSDTVVEIGPGRGVLTDVLAQRGSRVIAIEIDRALAAQLREKYGGVSNVEIIEGDALAMPISSRVNGPYIVAGNVPYYITTPIIFHVLHPPLPTRAVFLVQREVASRIVAPPGSKEYGALSVNVQAIASTQIIRRVPPSAFQPRPSVESAVIRITPLATPAVPDSQLPAFRAVVQSAFGMRRKQMINVVRGLTGLSAVEAERILASTNVDPRARPETLSVEKFRDLANALR